MEAGRPAPLRVDAGASRVLRDVSRRPVKIRRDGVAEPNGKNWHCRSAHIFKPRSPRIALPNRRLLFPQRPAISRAPVETTGSGHPLISRQSEKSLLTDLEKRVEEIEARAAESKLLGNLSMDEEARIYNRRLAVELKEYALKLRGQMESVGKEPKPGA